MVADRPTAVITFPPVLNTMCPIEIGDPTTGLAAAFVPRYSIDYITEAWQSEGLNGVYLLLSDLRFTDGFRAYVGVTTDGFQRALEQRNERTHWWSNAILFASPNGAGLTAAQTAELKAVLASLLQRGAHVTVETDDAEPESLDRQAAQVEHDGTATSSLTEAMVLFIVRVMFLKGYRSGSLARAVHQFEATALGQQDAE